MIKINNKLKVMENYCTFLLASYPFVECCQMRASCSLEVVLEPVHRSV